MRLVFFRLLHFKSIEAHDTRAFLTSRKLLHSKLRDIDNIFRVVLRVFVFNFVKTTECTFVERICYLLFVYLIL